MEVFDQQVATPRPVREQRLDLMSGRGVDLASLGRGFRPLPACSGMLERADLVNVVSTHETSPWNPALRKLRRFNQLYSLVCHRQADLERL
jgi:hypothetical protein